MVIFEEELDRLNLDKTNNSKEIENKEKELEILRKEADKFSQQLSKAKEFMVEFFCADCGAPMTEREHHSECVDYNGRGVDIDHEFVAFECGHQLIDGEINKSCPRKNS